MNREAFTALLPGIQLSIRASVAATGALAVGDLLGLPFPLYSLIAAVVVLDLSPEKTRRLGVQRTVGSVLGAVVGAAVSAWLPPTIWAIGGGVFAAMILATVLRLSDSARVAGYVSGITILGYDDQAWSYGFFRLVETVLGILLAVLVSFVPKLFSLEKPSRSPSS